VVVFRRRRGEVEYLLLHRAQWGRDFCGDWAWGSPGGHREVAERALACAQRELLEETGLTLICRPVAVGDGRLAYFTAEAPVEAEVTLSGEHDAFCWTDREAVMDVCLPRWVAEDFAGIADLVDGGDRRR
jgi:8-oxo-dGTP pyrophosphatase MutT (NUDIX family)